MIDPWLFENLAKLTGLEDEWIVRVARRFYYFDVE